MTTATVEDVVVDTRHWIGGERVASDTTFPDISPIDEKPLAEISAGGAIEVDAAVSAAQEAFPAWAALPREERADLLRKVADGVDARIEELAKVETRDNGSLSGCSGSCEPENGWRLYWAVASARATLAEIPTHCPVALP